MIKTGSIVVMLLAFIITIGSWSLTFKKSVSPLPDEQLFEKIDAYMKGQNDFSGALLAARRGKVFLSKGYGYADYECSRANTVHRPFNIASLTKSFTAVAIMILQEKKLLSVYDPICDYIEDWPDGDKITIHHLLTHTSGIQNFNQRESQMLACTEIDQIVDRVKKWPLEAAAGERFRYCNTGYFILAKIIESASGMPYNTFLNVAIFEPMNMKNTGDIFKTASKSCAVGYSLNDCSYQRTPPIVLPMSLLGNGNLGSSLQDMWIWDQALDEGRLLSKKSMNSLFEPPDLHA